MTERRALVLVLLLCIATIAAPLAISGEPEERLTIDEPAGAVLPTDMEPAGPPPAAENVEALTVEISAGLRCPVCQGLSVADSDSETAVSMKERVRVLVKAGYTEEQIRDYFVARYGTWILLAPPAEGVTWLLWLGPGILLGLAFAWAASVATRARRPVEEGPEFTGETPIAPDPFEQRLLDELEEDGT